MSLAASRCAHHPQREAAALCPSCTNYFCRECVTEHDGRVVCARCLAGLAPQRATGRRRLAGLGLVIQAVVGLTVAWVVFALFARVLVALPADVHEGTMWTLESPESE